MPEYYEIKIKGHLDQHWSDWFAGMKLTTWKEMKPCFPARCPTRLRCTVFSNESGTSI